MRRNRIAFHEAGHAVIAYRLGIEVKFVTILPTHHSAGHVARGDLFCGGTGSDHAALERAIKISLAGPMAEALFFRAIAADGEAMTMFVRLASRAILPVGARERSFATKSGKRKSCLISIGTMLSRSHRHCLNTTSSLESQSKISSPPTLRTTGSRRWLPMNPIRFDAKIPAGKKHCDDQDRRSLALCRRAPPRRPS